MRKRFWNASQRSGRSPLPQASAQPVLGLVRVRRRVGEVAAELADVLEQRAVVAHHVVPELARRELLADHHRAAGEQHRADRHHAAGGVIHRQAVVHAVVGPGAHHAGEGAAREHHAVVVDVGGLRQAGGAGRVDVERAVLDGQLRALRLRQRVAGQGVDHGVEAREIGALRRATRPWAWISAAPARWRTRRPARLRPRRASARRCRCNGRATVRPD